MEIKSKVIKGMDIKEIKKLTDEVDGWLHDEEAELLYKLAKSCKGKGVIVEVGSWKGKSTIYLALGSKNGNKVNVYAVDPHTGSAVHKAWYGKVWTLEEFKDNIRRAKVDDVVISVVKTSEEAAKDFNEPVELIFIDGEHEYDFVKLDFDLWFPKVIEGGIMAFHDTIGWPGPKKVVADHVYKSKYFKNVKFADSITFAQKVKQNTLGDRIKNRYVLLLKNLYEFLLKFLYGVSAKLRPPKLIKSIGRKFVKVLQLLWKYFQ